MCLHRTYNLHEKGGIMKSVLITITLAAFVLTTGLAFAASPSLKITPYGYIKLDSSYDTARTSHGNFAMWVNDNGGGDDDNDFNMTARQTRLGADIAFDNLSGPQVTGRFEVDFYGAGGGENKNGILMRHAFLKVDFDGWWIIAGQTWDVISPLNPSTVNYPVLWNCGNIGYRHPQLQLGMKMDSGLELVGSLSRNIGDDIDSDGVDDGRDSGIPTLQARVSYSGDNYMVGVAGHYGSMEYTDATGDDDTYSSYSLAVHASYTLSDAITIKGEAFTGATLNQYFGGIGQGYDTTLDEEVESSGGWINATFKKDAKTSFNIGGGADMPSTDDDKNRPVRRSNMAFYVNTFRTIAHNTTVAFELSHWTTGYWSATGSEEETSNLRAQLALILAIK